MVYAGSDDGHLYKLDDAGAPLWEHRAGDGRAHALIWTKPCLSPAGDAVYVGTVGGDVCAVATATGERLWTRRLPGGVASSIALGCGGELVFGCFDGAVYALHPEDGALAWRFPTLGLIYSSPAVDPDCGDIVVGSGDGAVYRLDRFGRRRWSYRTSGPIKSSPLLDGEGACTIGNEQGTLYRIDAAGRRLWSFDSGAGRRNDINASPSLRPDGTVVVGSTDGRLLLLGAGYAEAHAESDPRISRDPGPDGAAAPIPPCGAALVPLDARGQPELAALAASPVRPSARLPGEALVLDLLAVDAEGEPVAARLDPAALRVAVDPPRAFACSVPASGRTVHVVFEDLLPAGSYRVTLEGAYEAAGERRALAQEVVVEVPAPGGGCPPEAEADRVPAVLIDGWSLIRPREVDALSQAALDAMTYEVAIIHVDRARRTFVAVGACVAIERGQPVWKPRSPNRFVGAGRFDGPAFRIEGPARTIAQGNRCRFERVAMSGRFTAAGGIERGTGVTFLPAREAQGFTEVVRAMGLTDGADRIVSSGRFTARPLAGPEAARPADLAVAALEQRGQVIEARFTTPGAGGPQAAAGARGDAAEGPAATAPERWLHAVVVLPETGAVLDPEGLAEEVHWDARGRPAALRVTLPEALAVRPLEVIVLADLFPLATACLEGEG